MAKGMAIPIGVNGRGGAKVLKATPYTRQVILSGLTPNTSKNPFQAGNGVEVGISESTPFSVNGPGAEAKARGEITRFFARLRVGGIAKLAPGNEGISFDPVEHEISARVRFVDLEADEEDEVESNLKDGLRGSPGNVGGLT